MDVSSRAYFGEYAVLRALVYTVDLARRSGDPDARESVTLAVTVIRWCG